MLLSPPALRCFLVLASELKPDGSSSATLAELKKRIGHPMATLSKAVRSLIHLDLIAKKAQSCYWVDGTFFYTLNLHTR